MVLRMVEKNLNWINFHVFTYSFKNKNKNLRIPNEYVNISPSWSNCCDDGVGTGEFWGHRYGGTTSPRAAAKKKRKDILNIILGKHQK